ncbi:hypothetical protein PAEAM_16490 [Paenibacillus sp. GM1FR]|nr:hypothetical protein PAEAM_16490 [Paenibacillus sp. GM1FR]
MIKGNLSNGKRFDNKEYSILIIGKESLMGTPEIMGVLRSTKRNIIVLLLAQMVALQKLYLHR